MENCSYRIMKEDLYQWPGGHNGLHCHQVCRWHQTKGDQLICFRAGLSSRETWTGQRDELTGTLWNSARTNTKSCTWEGRNSCNGTGWALWMEGPRGCKLSTSQQHALVQRWRTASQTLLAGAQPADRGKNHPLYSKIIKPFLKYCIQFCNLPPIQESNWGQFSKGTQAGQAGAPAL